MNDDLNTAIAVSVIFDLTGLTNKLLEHIDTTQQTLGALDNLFRLLGANVLGIVRETYAHAGIDEYGALVNSLVKILIEQRNEARKNKNFAAADVIRNELSQIGLVLEDTPSGTNWREE